MLIYCTLPYISQKLYIPGLVLLNSQSSCNSYPLGFSTMLTAAASQTSHSHTSLHHGSVCSTDYSHLRQITLQHTKMNSLVHLVILSSVGLLAEDYLGLAILRSTQAYLDKAYNNLQKEPTNLHPAMPKAHDMVCD